MKKPKIAGILMIVPIIAMVAHITTAVFNLNQYDRNILSPWILAVQSASLSEKSVLVDQYVNNILSNRIDYASHNAIFCKTDANSFSHNLTALKSLQQRLHEVKEMNPASIEYAKAIEQITEQEQMSSKISAVNETIRGCYFLKNHKWHWEWFGVVSFAIGITMFCTGMVIFFNEI